MSANIFSSTLEEIHLARIRQIKLRGSFRVFTRRQRSENSLATMQNFQAKFRSFSERASLFHNNSPATLHYSPAATVLNENPVL